MSTEAEHKHEHEHVHGENCDHAHDVAHDDSKKIIQLTFFNRDARLRSPRYSQILTYEHLFII